MSDLTLHPYIVAKMDELRAKLYPSGVIDFSKNPELAVTAGRLVEHKNGRSVYQLTIDNGTQVKHERVSAFARKWNKTEYGGAGIASEIGTELHAAIADCLDGQPRRALSRLTHSASRHCYDLFLDWMEGQEELEQVVSEGLVWAWSPAVVGRVDCVFRTSTGHHWLVDYKSTNLIDQTYFIQIWLYAYCLSRLGIPIDKAVILSLPKPEQGQTWTEYVVWDTAKPETLSRREQLSQVVFAMGSLQLLWPQIRQSINDSRHTNEAEAKPLTTTCPNCGAPVDTSKKPFVFLCASCAQSTWGDKRSA